MTEASPAHAYLYYRNRNVFWAACKTLRQLRVVQREVVALKTKKEDGAFSVSYQTRTGHCKKILGMS